jgi:hypothetical protein
LKMKKNDLQIHNGTKSKKLLNSFKDLLVAFLLCYTATIIFTPHVIALTIYPINKAAVKEVMNGTRTEANASWWGFNETDATYALQEAIRSKANKIIVPDMGKPWVVEPIFLESDKEIIFEKGVVIAAKPGAFRGRTASLFKSINKRNISLKGYGAKFIMRKQDYIQPPYEKAEWRHCIALEGSQNIKIYGLRLANSGGDGICIGRGIGKVSLPSSDNIHIKDVICDNNHRQGISIGSASNLLIENCIFQNTSGTPPQAGIDFEPDNQDEVLINCKVKDCIFRDNSGLGIAICVLALSNNSKKISIEIEGCRILGNKQGAVGIADKKRNVSGVPRGSIIFRNCKINGQIGQHNTQMLDIKFE